MSINKELYDRLEGYTLEELTALAEPREKQLKDARWAISEYLKLYPYLGFKPHPGQYRALQMIQKGVDEGKMKFGMFCGEGWGKTLSLVNMAYNVMCPPQHRNFYFRLPFIENWNWPKRIRLVCMADDLKEFSGAVAEAIDEWWPKSEYTKHKQEHAYVNLYRHRLTGFTLDVKTHDQALIQHKSNTLGLILFNEPPPSSLWQSYPGRLRRGGIMICAATLVFESKFFKEDVIDNPNAVYTYGDVEENCSTHSRMTVEINGKPEILKGHLTHGHIEATIREAPKHEQEARKTGRPVHLAGAAFNIVPAVHFIQREHLPNISQVKCSILALDPHQRRPWAFKVTWETFDGIYYVVDEWPRVATEPWRQMYHRIDRAGVGFEFYAKAIKKKQAEWNVATCNMVIDSKFAGQMMTTDMEAHKLREVLMHKYGLIFQGGHTSVRGEGGGIGELERLLAFDQEQEVNYLNRPRFFVCDDLTNSKYQLENITWDEKADPDQYGMKEVLDEKLLDFVRLDMYTVMHHSLKAVSDPTPASDRTEEDLSQEKKAQDRLGVMAPEREEPVLVEG